MFGSLFFITIRLMRQRGTCVIHPFFTQIQWILPTLAIALFGREESVHLLKCIFTRQM